MSEPQKGSVPERSTIIDEQRSNLVILMVDDDEEDRMLTKEALTESRVAGDLRFAADGEELLDYLRCRGRYSPPNDPPRPALILLDLNMPRKDGREVLREIKSDPALRAIPVIILTTSRAREDIERSYHLGANSFVTKPPTFSSLVQAMRVLGHYWTDVVQLPSRG